MHEYDTALKRALQRPGGTVLAQLTGLVVNQWHNVELPLVNSRRVDLLGEDAYWRLVHIELQSRNDPAMALRMAEYSYAIYRCFGRFPESVVLYVGQAALRMAGRLEGPNSWFECRMVDIRELDGERLIESGELGDNIVAILARLADRRGAVRRILGRIAGLAVDERETALTELMILAGLRRLGPIVREEVKKMPILDDIMDHEVLGPIKRLGLEMGRQEGRQEGFFQGERTILTRLIEKRFGPVPVWAHARLSAMTLAETEDAALRLLDAASLTDLLGESRL